MGNLNSFMDSFVKSNANINGSQTYDIIDKALRYELLTMNEKFYATMASAL